MNNTLPSSINRRHALALLGAGLALGAGTPARAADAAWEATIKAARGQTVYFNAWAGSDSINAYIRWAAQEVEQRFGVQVKHVKISDAADAYSAKRSGDAVC